MNKLITCLAIIIIIILLLGLVFNRFNETFNSQDYISTIKSIQAYDGVKINIKHIDDNHFKLLINDEDDNVLGIDKDGVLVIVGQNDPNSTWELLSSHNMYDRLDSYLPNGNGRFQVLDQLSLPQVPVPVPGLTAAATPPKLASKKCIDNNVYCEDWANNNECDKNPLWMHVHCKKSCDKCGSAAAANPVAPTTAAPTTAATCENNRKNPPDIPLALRPLPSAIPIPDKLDDEQARSYMDKNPKLVEGLIKKYGKTDFENNIKKYSKQHWIKYGRNEVRAYWCEEKEPLDKRIPFWPVIDDKTGVKEGFSGGGPFIVHPILEPKLMPHIFVMKQKQNGKVYMLKYLSGKVIATPLDSREHAKNLSTRMNNFIRMTPHEKLINGELWSVSKEAKHTKELRLVNTRNTPFGEVPYSDYDNDPNKIKINLNIKDKNLAGLLNLDNSKANDNAKAAAVAQKKCDTYLPKDAVCSLCPGCCDL